MTHFYCANIHKNLRIEGNYNTGLKLMPCCVFKTNTVYNTLDEYNSSDELMSLKTATDWPTGCITCKKQEELGQRSYRNDALNSLSDVPDGKKRYEIFPSNVCNLKCLMCSPQTSTALAHEHHAVGLLSNSSYNKEFELAELALDVINQGRDVESITLLGGEFFLAKSNDYILDFAIDNNIPLRVVTNATVITSKHFEKLKKINSLELQISIDGIEQSYEFMRYPATWDKFTTNATKIINGLPHAKINFHFVVQPLNVQNLIPTLHYVNKFRVSTRITNLVFPEHLSWCILKQTEKIRLIDEIKFQLSQQYLLTKQQKLFIDELIFSISRVDYSFTNRNNFIDYFCKVMAHRQIPTEIINTQLGVLTTLTTI